MKNFFIPANNFEFYVLWNAPHWAVAECALRFVNLNGNLAPN
jgi:hypothetical protein